LVGPGSWSTPELYLATAGVPLFRNGSVNYTWEARRSSPAEFGLTTPDGVIDDSLVRSQSHSLRTAFRLFGGAQLSGSATLTHVSGQQIWSGFAGVNVVFGRQTMANVTYSSFPGSESTYASLDRPLPAGVGVGYRIAGSDLGGGTANAQFEANTPFNGLRVTYDAMQGGSQQTGSVTLAGGLGATGGGLFFSRELHSSAALVEVTGLKHVRVLADNVVIGRTNGSGRLLIPELLPYLANRISVDESDIPFEYSVPVLSQLIAPPFRGAAYVRFVTARVQGRDGSVRVKIAGEDVVPAFGSLVVQVEGRDVESPLNSAGEFFLDLPDGHHTGTVTYKGHTCRVEFDAAPTRELVQHLGVLRCAP
jgi:outer membrane usher protein